MKHLSEEDLILLYYNEPVGAAEARTHVAECTECKAAADSLAQTLDLCSEWGVPEPDAAFERSVWAGIAPALVAEPRRGFASRWFAPRVWVAVTAAGILMAGAFVLGRVSGKRNGRSGPATVMAGLSSQARERILEISLADHLDRAGMLLTEISNTGTPDARGFALERGRAQDLVEEGRLMRQTLEMRGGSATLAFLDEVERFLLEVANAPDAVNPGEMREMRERIGSGSLLFKVRIIEANLRTQGQKL
jgi:hypothetical protein